MAITYKGFQIQVCNPDPPYDSIGSYGNFEFSVVSWNASSFPSNRLERSLEDAISYLSSSTGEQSNLSGVICTTNHSSSSYISPVLAEMQEIIPMAVGRDIPTSCIGKKVKLVSSNGYYAVSTGILSGSSYVYLDSDGYTLYDDQGNNMGSAQLYIFNNSGSGVNRSLSFLAIGNGSFNGSLPSGLRRSECSVIEVNSHYNGTVHYYHFHNHNINSNSTVPEGIINWFNAVTPLAPENTDPYEQGGHSGTGGGTGDFDGASDSIDFPSLPSLSAVDAGFITLFNPSVAQLNSLASYMWSNPLFDINAWKKIFADPMDAILGLSIVPVAVPSGGTKEVTVGNIPTGVYLTTASSQYVVVDCGTLNVNEYWGAYLDYEPYTKAEIYLPYVGIHPIAVDDIMGKSVHVKYHIDILSGACCAMVKCGDSIMYSFIGQCSSSIPITGDNWTNVINGAISIAGSIGSMVASAKMTGISNMSDEAKKIENASNIMRGSSGIASTLVNQMKPSIERSGAMGGTGGMLGVQTPFIILTRPRQALPERQNEYIGYPSFITMRLGDLSGYTEVESIHIENVPATDSELSEIEAILKSGVIF